MDWSSRIGVAGLGLFAAGGFANQGVFYAGLLLMLLALSLRGRDFWRRARSRPFVWVSLALSGYITVNWLLAWLQGSAEWRPEILESGFDLLLAGGAFSLVVAYWLGAGPRRIRWVLGLGLAGLVLSLAVGFDWSRLEVVMGGRRELFGMGNGAALYAGTGLIGVLILLLTGRVRPLWLVPPALLLVVALAIVVLWSQTRAVWVALAVILPTLLLAMAWHGWRHGRGGRTLLLLLAGAGMLGATIVFNADIVDKRLARVEGGFLAILTDDGGGLEGSGLQYRVPLWEQARKLIGERPWFGWGAGTSRMLISELDIKQSLTHYHNLYLQLLVELGAVGLVLFLLWVVTALKTFWPAGRRDERDFPLLLFLLAAMALFLLAGLFQIRHDDERGHFFLISFGALAVSRALYAGVAPATGRRPAQ
ncbi:hypothetical protein TspCOW1_13220 [Thiohalobacter sp. COW1]|uniref:O-antigen ligase family protein n=1 Tax=Thiohalobacter sp. COW1 TaxID=2795687 RepID=UPI001915B8FD|nr:O-antigen ligase family protein [Thiohalobacter sp. COW1]BCO31219.1 hypothetical protein TspCOW1_13220 [Thiohalobacter sp. COW1]